MNSIINTTSYKNLQRNRLKKTIVHNNTPSQARVRNKVLFKNEDKFRSITKWLCHSDCLNQKISQSSQAEFPFRNGDAFRAITQWLPHNDCLNMRLVSQDCKGLINESLKVILTPKELHSDVFFEPFPYKNEKLEFAERNDLKIKIKEIISASDVEIVIKFIMNPANLAFLKQIKVIELGNIGLKNGKVIQELLSLLARKNEEFVNLSSIIIGDLNDKMIITIDGLNSLDELIIGNIYERATLAIRNLVGLKSFSCKNLDIGSNLTIEGLKNLISFFCGNIFENSILKLNDIKRLKFISFENIMHDAILILKDLDKLDSITFRDTYPGAMVVLNHLKSLTSFICSDIFDVSTLSLPGSLSNLSYGTVQNNEMREMLEKIKKEIQEKKGNEGF